ncbi:MAG: hypothetical protein ACKVIO_03145, partial [Phycisphaerales bacterium]
LIDKLIDSKEHTNRATQEVTRERTPSQDDAMLDTLVHAEEEPVIAREAPAEAASPTSEADASVIEELLSEDDKKDAKN